MSALIYKQRFFHPNHTKTPVSNYVHIGYIATRPGAVRHEDKNHGLFGKLQAGSLQAFDSWQEVARIARQISREGKNMYRSVISFKTDMALEIGLSHFENWQAYIEQHIATIAAQNQIKIENLAWAAAFHNEKNHPHLHVVFWDKSQSIMRNFTHPEIPNRIRKQLIKDTFAYKIEQFYAQRDQAKSGIREITDTIVDEFEQYLKHLHPKAFRSLNQRFQHEDEDSILRFPTHHLLQPALIKELTPKLFKLRHLMPKSGKLAYKLLPQEIKAHVDILVRDLLDTNPYLAQMTADYIQAKLQVSALYTSNPNNLAAQERTYQAEADKRIANRILSTIRTIIKLERETASNTFSTQRQQAITGQLLLELLSMMEGLAMQSQLDADDKTYIMGGELSKQAKKEWLLAHKDKGLEQ